VIEHSSQAIVPYRCFEIAGFGVWNATRGPVQRLCPPRAPLPTESSGENVENPPQLCLKRAAVYPASAAGDLHRQRINRIPSSEIIQPLRADRAAASEQRRRAMCAKNRNTARGEAASHLRPARGKSVVLRPTLLLSDGFESPIQARRRRRQTAGIRQLEICRLRLAPASGISALMELWPSG
jgi:hypothetical protein